MKKNEFDVPVDWGKLSSHKPAKHSKSDKQIYWGKIRMASKKKKFNIDKELNEMKDNEQFIKKLKEAKNLLEIQSKNVTDEYMKGLYSGMELILSIFESREPIYWSKKEVENDKKDRLLELYDMAEPPMFETLARGKHSGYEFFIVWCSSHPNAYIKIPEGHPFYKKDYTNIDDKCIVYGGFTFSGEDLDKRYGLPEGWYLGWDYAHSTDFINLPGYFIGGFKCAIKNIETVCKKVIDNIIKEAE